MGILVEEISGSPRALRVYKESGEGGPLVDLAALFVEGVHHCDGDVMPKTPIKRGLL